MQSPKSGTLALVFLVRAYGQNVAGEIRGEVVDPGGADVANAKVTLTNSGTGGALKATTNATGVFVFPSVAAGA